jgi:hypothetical protein
VELQLERLQVEMLRLCRNFYLGGTAMPKSSLERVKPSGQDGLEDLILEVVLNSI